MNLYLACFDITDDANRTRVGKHLSDYGQRVQRSVFEITVAGEPELERLKAELAPLLAAGDDLRFYAICRACRRRSYNHRGERVAYIPAATIL
jgi:CRISPR-associated endonuclease Cas2